MTQDRQEKGRALRVRVLPDEPSKQDHFQGGHERVAEALVDLFRATDGGRTIGLEGEWGSGKSTVVELIRSKLAGDENYQVFVYDTWAHDGDPLRRSFLEALGDYLAEIAWIDSAKWEETKEVLARRHKNTRKTITHAISEDGRWVVGSIIVGTPVGTTLLSQGIASGSRWLTGAGFGLVLLPLVLASVLSAKNRHQQDGDESTGPDDNDVWPLLFARTTTTSDTDSFETPDPTSIEFAQSFNKLVTEALREDESRHGRRLIVVLDNLDRVDTPTALSTLATLQTFFSSQHSANRSEWRDQVWVVLPYDRTGLSKLWRGDEEMLELFLSKIRSLRFEVPPLILSDWRAYLDHLLKEAFEGAEEDVLEEVAAVLVAARLDAEEWRGHSKTQEQRTDANPADTEPQTPHDHAPEQTAPHHSSSSPTPRNLIRLVNLVGTLYRIWSDDIPLSHLAYYAALRDSQIAVDAALLEGSVPSSRVLAHISGAVGESGRSDLVRNLAALHFNCDLGRADELLLAGWITAALTQGDHERVREMLSRHPRAFQDVLEGELAKGWPANSGRDLIHMGQALLRAGAFENLRLQIRNGIKALVKEAKAWELASRDEGELLARFAQALAFRDSEMEELLASISAADAVELEPPVLRQRIEGVTGFVAVLAEDGVLERLSDTLRVVLPGNDAQFFQAVEILAEEDADGLLWKHVNPRPTGDVVQDVIEWITKERVEGESIKTLRVLASNPSLDLSPVVEKAKANVADPNSPLPQVKFAVEMLEVLPGGADAIMSVAPEGLLLNHLGREVDAEFGAKLAYYHLTATKESPKDRSATHPHEPQGIQKLSNFIDNPQNEPELFDSVANRVIEHAPDLPFDFKWKNADEIWPWAGEMIRRIAADHPEILDPRRFIGHWSVLAKALPRQERLKHRDRLLRDGDLLGALLAQIKADGGDFTPYRGAVRYVLEATPGESATDARWRSLFDAAVVWLRGRTEDNWKEALRNDETDDVWIAKTLLALGVHPQLGNQFKQAILDYAFELIEGTAHAPSQDQVATYGQWDNLPDLLGGQGARDGIPAQLIGKLATHLTNEPVSPEFWQVFGSFLAGHSKAHADDRLLPGVVSGAIQRNDDSTVEWAATMFEQHPEAMEAQPELLRSLREEVQDELGRGEDRPALKRLALSIGISEEE